MKTILNNYQYEITIIDDSTIEVFRKFINSIERYQTDDAVIVDQKWIVVPKYGVITRWKKEKLKDSYSDIPLRKGKKKYKVFI